MLVGIAATLGLTYVASASVKLAAARNFTSASQARLAAESGLEHAKYILEKRPGDFDGGVTLGPFVLEAGGYTYSIRAVSSPLTPGVYRVTSEGLAGGRRWQSVADISCPGTPRFSLVRAVQTGANTELPLSFGIEGNVHINGSLTNRSRIAGDATYTGSISGSLSAITGTYYKVARQDIPAINWQKYQHYTLSGQVYDCAQSWDAVYSASSPLNNGAAITGSNVGGVVRMQSGTVVIGPDVDFTGTLITNGTIIFDGANIRLRSVDGFPALVANGWVYLRNGANVTIDGVVAARSGIGPLGTTTNSRLVVRGAVVTESGAISATLTGSHSVTFDAGKARLYDIESSASGTATVTNWLQ
jgi:hypothetical protein